jgi:hypothetical protein
MAPYGIGKKGFREFLPGSTAIAGRQHGQAAPAMLAGNPPGFLVMIPGGLVHNNTLSRARGAGETDHVTGSGAQDIGM